MIGKGTKRGDLRGCAQRYQKGGRGVASLAAITTFSSLNKSIARKDIGLQIYAIGFTAISPPWPKETNKSDKTQMVWSYSKAMQELLVSPHMNRYLIKKAARVLVFHTLCSYDHILHSV